MSLLALLFALACERGLTHLLHLREWRWLDPYVDAVDRALGDRAGPVTFLAAVVVVALPVVPVAVVAGWLEPYWLGLPGFAFAVLVLLFSFGPRDLKDEVDEYIAALERRDRDEALRLGKELLESSPAVHGRAAREAVEEAIFVQANNRIFGVVFWFLVLGPAGAWAYRVSDMLRRRVAFQAARAGLPRRRGDFGSALVTVHGLLAWVPARLCALAYAIAGSFEDAVGNWRRAVDEAASGVLGRAEDLLARVGKGSLAPSLAGVPADDLDVATARGAWRIVSRALWFWVAVVAVLVLVGAPAVAATSPDEANTATAGSKAVVTRSPRILSLAPNLTEIAYAAGAGPLLVGTVEFSDYPAEARSLARVGDAWRVDLERVVALQPDVVLVWPTGTPATTIAQLRRLGLNVVEVPTQHLEDIAPALRQVGQLAGTTASAERAAAAFEAGMAKRRALHASKTSLSAFIQIDDQPLFTVNGRHVISEVVALCGGRNVFKELPQLAPPIAVEAVIAADPQVILNTDETVADVRDPWRQWPRLQAVRTNAIFALPADLVARATPRLLQGIDATCAALDRARALYY